MELNDEESILGATLSFQASSTEENNELEDSAPIQESNATKALKAVKYVKLNLDEYVRTNKDLKLEQQSKLLRVHTQHEDLFQGKRGEWKGIPVSHPSQKYAMVALLVQVVNRVEQTISTFSRKFNDAQLKYTVGHQELLAAHKVCRHFHPIIYGCNVLIKSDHKNLTFDGTKILNLRVQWQRITLDQEYQAKFKHFASELNTGAEREIQEREICDYYTY